MTRTTKRIWSALIVLISALFGVAVFLSLYGREVLDPAYTQWLMDGGSLSKSFLGWRLFQGADWQFPLGAIASLGYPQQATLATTDSIPLLAILAKLLSPANGTAQYLGWWALACFPLQGALGALIALRATRSPWLGLLGGFLFVLVPVLWQSTFTSAGLGGHWVVLAGLLALLYRRELSARRGLPYVIWGLLGALSISIHGQCALVCGILCFSYTVYVAVATKEMEKTLPFAIFLTAVLAVGGALGTFSSGSATGIRFLGMNPLALFDARNYSHIMRNLTKPRINQYAEFAYLGFGALLLFVMALVFLLRRAFAQTGLRAAVKARLADILAFGLSGLFCVLLGLGQPLVYLVLAGALLVLSRWMGKGLLTALLALCLCFQAYDLSEVWQAKHLHYQQKATYEPTLDMDSWNALLSDDTWQTVMISPDVSQSAHLASLVEAVKQNGQTLNTLSLAKDDYDGWEAVVVDPEEDMVFVFTAAELMDKGYFARTFAHVDYLYQWGELVVGFARPTLLPSPQIRKAADITLTHRYPIGQNAFLRMGEDIGGTRYIYDGGISYGPYLSLAVGQYEVRITGGQLDQARIYFTISDKAGAMTDTLVSASPTEMVFHLDVTEAATDVEVLLENSSSSTLFFDAITVKAISNQVGV